MSKGSRIFLSVIYYIVAFIFGIFLSIVLPYTLSYTSLMSGIVEDLNNGKYASAIAVVGGYYNSDHVVCSTWENGGIVLFEATTLVYNSGEEGDTTKDESKLQKTYAGYIWGVRDEYIITQNTDNRSGIGIVDKGGNETKNTFIDYDSDKDGTKDTNSFIAIYDLLYIDFPMSKVDNISAIKFYDKDGLVYKTINVDLTFSGAFFSDVDDFMEEYNTNPESDNLDTLNSAFLAKSDSYHISSYGDHQKGATRKAIAIIIAYFLIVYIIGDTLIGPRYFIKGIKWILKKVFKVKFKSDETVNPDDVYGHDYFCNLTLSLKLEEGVDLDTAVLISYDNPQEGKLEFALIKQENYTQSKQVKAGTYLNPFIQMKEDYVALDMPDNLIVKGYRMNIEIKIKKRME